MARSSILEDEDSGLLLKTSESVMEMAHSAQINDPNIVTRFFYSHLASHCSRFRDFSVRTRKTSPQINGELVNQALIHLGSIVSESYLQQLPLISGTLEFRLRMLNLYWSEAR